MRYQRTINRHAANSVIVSAMSWKSRSPEGCVRHSHSLRCNKKPRRSPFRSHILPQHHTFIPHFKTFTSQLFLMSLPFTLSAALDWMYGENDSNFDRVMQLMAPCVCVVHYLYGYRSSPQHRHYIWVLTGFSVVCTVANAPFCSAIPTIWRYHISTAGALAGVLALVIAQLQTVYVIFSLQLG